MMVSRGAPARDDSAATIIASSAAASLAAVAAAAGGALVASDRHVPPVSFVDAAIELPARGKKMSGLR